jgi:Nickel responsive protein SCO4226-like
MPKYVIEREIPNAGRLTDAELRAISEKSCSVLRVMGPKIQWLESYVTGDKIYCLYRADSEDSISEHAAAGGFPANRIAMVRCTIDPGTAE